MTAPLIELVSVEKTYPGGQRALRGVSFSVTAGEFVVLLGRSGAGKSTILRAITGLADPTAGSLRFAGERVNRSTLRSVRRHVATIHQQFNLVGRASVAANILSGAIVDQPFVRVATGWYPPALRRRAWALLQRVGLGEEHLLRRAQDLSGGQQQRVGIARALMLDPRLILADEPVASLDPKVSRDVLGLLHSAARERGAAVLCSLHQIDLAREFGDRIIGIADGSVHFDGPSTALTPAIIARLYGEDAAPPLLEAAS